MVGFYDGLADRFMVIVVNIIKLEKQLCKTYSGRHIYGQLFRAGTSTGANYEEARAGESRADFVHKMQIVLKELRESHYWIKLIISGELIKSEDEILRFLLTDHSQIHRDSQIQNWKNSTPGMKSFYILHFALCTLHFALCIQSI